MSLISKFFLLVETRLVPPCLNWWRTFYVNFRLLPISQAIKFPIFIYGKVKFPNLSGSVIFRDCIIRKGMIKIGKQDPFSVSSESGFVSISPKGKIIFNGPAQFSSNIVIRIFDDGIIEIGKFVYFGSGNKIVCNSGLISIGDYTRFTFNSSVMNSSFHSVVDINTGKIRNHIRPIIIGAKSWIGNGSSINGGTFLKPFTIVGSGSYVNKDFSILKEECQLIGGRPAKLIKSNVARIFNPKIEQRIINFFKANPNENIYVLDDTNLDDMSDLEKDF